MAIVHATDGTFDQEVLKAPGLVLVDFWAEWCGPCKMLEPTIEEIAEEMGNSLKIVKVNIDENPTPPTQYGVRGIPTLMIFKDGKLIDSKVGVAPKSALLEWIRSHQ